MFPGSSPRRVSAGLLILEITESAIIGDIHASRAVLRELRRMGVRVALDDFGTGYSSLTHLSACRSTRSRSTRASSPRCVPVSQDALIIDAVITLAHSLGMSTIAEGVETAGAAGRARPADCDSVAGLPAVAAR